MKHFNRGYALAVAFFIIGITILSSCADKSAVGAIQPTIEDYSEGEKWVWKYKGETTQGEVRSEGEDTKQIVRLGDALGMTIDKDTVPLLDVVKPEESETPRYDWPLEVGKKWKYEINWTSQDGTTGKQSQDATVLSYKEETVAGGTFMAYTVEYKGTVSNSRGYSAQTDEVWLYAPEIKNFIKLTQTQDDFLYVEELIEYANPNKD